MKKRLCIKSALRRRRAHDGELLETAQRHARGFQKSTEAHGLEIHPSRTKILTSQKANKL